MGDVYISFSPLDRARVRPVAERLTSLGYRVVFEPGASAAEKLEAVPAVLVVWTQSALSAPGVFAAAARALDEEKLLQMRLDEVLPPAPFSGVPLADMSGERAEWGQLEQDLQRMTKGGAGPAPTTQLREPGLFATPAPAGAPKRITLLLALTLLGFTTALAATYTGLMRPEQMQIAMAGVLGLAGLGAAFAFYRFLLMRRAGG
ncbi:MAG TPA: toll/interleukin-1 receptor domain-containing protein [Terricaulis sp.]|nr:toll/interleukin-1 receptor domain-containing protein [Terricaulis sp.]